ncbi:putative antitoxin of gyrase inhibiting toxin-antitoxin system [Escherichia coli]|uniref:Putative antitoxin of gyrase inhibiting toxin-antitoxin system n=1 Tax=Escherichia coli TaxID=562 RepID=A0A376H8S2_ECOLX|nr:putative antitoxin of gyrase inhibiting toxin-antitoxin system [Escherichia coli]
MTAKRTTQSVTVTVDRELVNRARDAGLNMSAPLRLRSMLNLKNMQQHVGVKRTQKLSLR